MLRKVAHVDAYLSHWSITMVRHEHILLRSTAIVSTKTSSIRHPVERQTYSESYSSSKQLENIRTASTDVFKYVLR